MAKYTVDLSPEEEKALLTDMISIQDWINNAVYNKARQCADAICHLALNDKTHTILTLAEKKQLRDYLDAKGIIITSVKELPLAVKKQIVAHARVKSATERDAEREAEKMKGKLIY